MIKITGWCIISTKKFKHFYTMKILKIVYIFPIFVIKALISEDVLINYKVKL